MGIYQVLSNNKWDNKDAENGKPSNSKASLYMTIPRNSQKCASLN